MGNIDKLYQLLGGFYVQSLTSFPRILSAAPRILPDNSNIYLSITLEFHKPDVYSFVFVRREFRDDFPNFSITLFFERTLVFLIRTTGTKHIFLIFYIAVFHIRQGFICWQIFHWEPFRRKKLGEFFWRCIQFAAKYCISKAMPFLKSNPFYRFRNRYFENLFIMSSLFRIPGQTSCLPAQTG